jgi:hypothetical protein
MMQTRSPLLKAAVTTMKAAMTMVRHVTPSGNYRFARSPR